MTKFFSSLSGTFWDLAKMDCKNLLAGNQYFKGRPKKRICFAPCFSDQTLNLSGHDNAAMKCSGEPGRKRNNKRMGLTHEASNRTGGSRGKKGSNSNGKAAAAQQEIRQHHFKSKRIFAATEGARTNRRATKQELLVESDNFGKHIWQKKI